VSPLNIRAIVRGAATALAMIIPMVIVVRLLVGDDDVDTTWQYLFAAFILVATVIGTAVTGRHERSAPFTHGAIAGAATFLVAQILSSLVQGDLPNVLALVFFTVAFMCLGAIGGFLGAR
jgi:putative membrane protein (TIGR04086 family)